MEDGKSNPFIRHERAFPVSVFGAPTFTIRIKSEDVKKDSMDGSTNSYSPR
jgi:hypothetical protein